MCPLCLGTATWIISGGSSAGGVAALFLRRAARRDRATRSLDPVRASRAPVSAPAAKVPGSA
jgi:hypothetical protein